MNFRKIFISTLFMCFLAGPLAAAPSGQLLVDQVQNELAIWNLARARELLDELQRLTKDEPDNQIVLYLSGVTCFYEGRYTEAGKYFDRVKELSTFEPAGEGFVVLTREILAEKITLVEKSSKNLKVHYQTGSDEILADYLELEADRIRRSIDDALGFDPGNNPLIVEIYPNTTSFAAASPLTLEDVKTSGTIGLCKYGRVLLTTPRSLLHGYPWMDTLSHEYVHYVLTRKWGQNIPIWLHEGIAKYLEAKWRGERPGHLPPSFENLLALALKSNDFVSFDEMYPSFAKLPSAERAQLAYAQVVSLVDFLVQEKGGLEKLKQLLTELSRDENYEKAFLKVHKADTSEILADWRKWLRGQNLKIVAGLDPQTLQFVEEKSVKSEKSGDRKDLEQITSKSAREIVHLGDLLRARGKITAAIVEYERAQKQLPGVSPVIGTKLGLAYHLNGNLTAARSTLEKVVENYPGQGFAFQILADTYAAQEQWKKAEENYRRALYINPFNPELHSGMIKVSQKLGDSAGVKRSQRALQLLTPN